MAHVTASSPDGRFAARGWRILHLMTLGRIEPHPLNPDARMVDGVLRYPAAGSGQDVLF